MLGYLEVCWDLLKSAGVCWGQLRPAKGLPGLFRSAEVCLGLLGLLRCAGVS